MRFEPLLFAVGLLVIHLGHIVWPIPQARLAPVTGAVIQHWIYDAPTRTVNVRILNTGNKPITAYILDVVETNADGPSESHALRDFLNNTVFLERIKGTANEESLKKHVTGPIPVSGSYDEKLTVSKTFKTIDLTVEAVAFSDKTAEAVSTEAFGQLVASRKSTIASIDKGLEVINASGTLAEATANIQKAYDADQATTHTSLDTNPGELLSIVNDLKQLPNRFAGLSEKDALANYVALKQRERSIFAAQADLTLEVAQ